MSINKIINIAQILFEGLYTSLTIFGIVLLLSIILGVIVALCSNSKNKILSKIINIYVLVIRGTPLMLQIIFVYFAPYYLFKLSFNRFTALIIAFVINYAAYFSEIFRGGINSIPEGQKEAAFTLGMNKIQIFFIIIIPQTIKRILPALSNEVISLIKNTSLAHVIGITEMFSLAQKQSSFEFSIVPICIAGLYYLIICTMLTICFKKMENKLDYYKIT